MVGLFKGEAMSKSTVQVIAGSKTDLPALKKVTEVLSAIGVNFSAHIISAHRNPKALRELCVGTQSSEIRDVRVFVALAAWAAHLAGAVAAETGFMIPVIGVPLPGGPYPNDSLYSMASMPPGCPVLIVPTPENAAIAAAQIVAIADHDVASRLRDYLAVQFQKKQPQLCINLNTFEEETK